jgi:hypothetical protein
MAGNLFDVFVVGSTDPSAAGGTRLAAALSAKHGVPLATVAKAIAAKNLRAGQSLEQAQAQALVRQLQSIGAVTLIRPAFSRTQVSGSAPRPPVPPSVPVGGRTVQAGPAAASAWADTPTPLGNDAANNANALMSNSQMGGMDGAGMPAIAPATNDPFSPLGPSAGVASAARGVDPFQPRPGVAPSLAAPARPRQPTPSPPSRISPPAPALALDTGGGARLELARGDHGGSDDELSGLRQRPTGSAASLREIGMGASSGVAMDEDPKNLNLVRCVQHGLYYDKSKASGCRKCLSVGREIANKMQAEPAGFRVGDFRSKPARRAFLGLAFAFAIGFLPAAYYCFGPGAAEARNMRVEQELLSRQPGTEEILRRFDELDGQVTDSHGRSTRNTAIVWFAVTSVAMFGWYRIT